MLRIRGDDALVRHLLSEEQGQLSNFEEYWK